MSNLAYTLSLAADFTSGDVRKRYVRVCAAAAIDPSYSREKAMLEAVLPDEVPISAIDLRLGSPWIAADIIQEFIADVLGISAKVTYCEPLAHWAVEALSDTNTLANITTYGINYETLKEKKGTFEPKEESITGIEMLEMALNLKQPVIKIRKEEDSSPEYSMVATTQAVAKMEGLQSRFADWCRSDPDLAHSLEKTYNDRYNCLRYRSWDGSYLTLDGMSETWRKRIFERKYQLDGIAMGIAQGGGLFFEVGLGKTVCGLVIAYERKRIGNCTSPWIAVQKQTLPDYVRTIREMYPQARVLVAGDKDLSGRNRQMFLARARANDYDFVVITHEQLERIPMSKAFVQAFFDERMAELLAAGKAINPSFDPKEKPKGKIHPTIKAILKQVAALKAKVKALQKQKDLGLTFEQSGCDLLIYDEYDKVKNLGYRTKMEQVVGLGNTKGSGRAFDFSMKSEFLRKVHGKYRLIGMTGTPISNTMAEFWKTLCDFAPDEMRAYGWHHFDAWAAQNGAIVNQPEVKHTGTIKMVSRFARFINLTEQMMLFKLVSLVKRSTDPDVDIGKPKGKRFTIASPMSDFQRRFADDLVSRAEACERDQPRKWCKLYWYDSRQLEAARAKHPDPEVRNFHPEFGWTFQYGDNRTGIEQAYLKLLSYSEGPGKGRAVKEVDPREFINKYGQEAADKYLRYGPIPVLQTVEEDDDDDNEEKVEKPPVWSYKMTTDNMLSISTAGRLSTTDARLVDPWVQDDPTNQALWAAQDNPRSKLHRCIHRVYGIYRRTRKQKATQIIFCDLSTPKGNKFTVYLALKQGLIAKGMPEDQIAFIHDYDSDADRKRLYEMMNEGKIAVLIASSAKAGIGLNIQRRLFALHHFDCPWRPRELEQRRGRMYRPGNIFEKIGVLEYTYVTQGYVGNCGYDAFLWQLVEAKLVFITAVLSGDLNVRTMEEDASESPVFSAAEIKALSTGDMRLMDYIRADNEFRKMESLIQGANNDIRSITSDSSARSLVVQHQVMASLTEKIALMEPEMPLLYEQADICTRDAFKMTVGSTEYENKTAAGRAIWALIDQIAEKRHDLCNKYVTLGTYGGLRMMLYVQRSKTEVYDEDGGMSEEFSVKPFIYLETKWENIRVAVVKDHHNLGQKIEEAYLEIFDQLVGLKSSRAAAEKKIESLHAELLKQQDNLISLKAKRDELLLTRLKLEAELGINDDAKNGKQATIIEFGNEAMPLAS